MTQDSPSRHLDQFLLRLPDGMRERIAEAARANKRSTNAEIVARLEQSFRIPPGTPDVVIAADTAAADKIFEMYDKICELEKRSRRE